MDEVTKIETAEEKFTRLAEVRVNKILNDVESLGKLSARNYSYTTEQVNVIFTALKTGIEEIYPLFTEERKTETKKKFSL